MVQVNSYVVLSVIFDKDVTGLFGLSTTNKPVGSDVIVHVPIPTAGGVAEVK